MTTTSAVTSRERTKAHPPSPMLAVLARIAVAILPQAAAAANPSDAFRTSLPPGRTVAERFLALEAQTTQVPAACFRTLDELTNTVARALHHHPAVGSPSVSRDQATDLLRQIDEHLSNLNLIYPPSGLIETLGDALMPHRLTSAQRENALRQPSNSRRRQRILANPEALYLFFDCDTSSFLYMGIADALGITLSLVEVPRHNFVRWQYAPSELLNWDTNEAASYCDKYYQQAYGVTSTQIALRQSLTSMTPEEVLGYLYSLRGNKAALQPTPSCAFEDFALAVALYPQSAAVTNNAAWFLATHAHTDPARGLEALSLATQALVLDVPNAPLSANPEYLDTLACAFSAIQDSSAAVLIQEHAVARDPKPAFQQRLATYRQGGPCRPTAPHSE